MGDIVMDEQNVERQNEKFAVQYHQVRLLFAPMAVHVDNDQALKEYMGFHMERAMTLAKCIKSTYKKRYGKTLRISTWSLAIELLGHFSIQEGCLLFRKVFGFLPEKLPVFRFIDWLLRHMDIIDCGEAECDNNRFLWDVLAIPFELKDRL